MNLRNLVVGSLLAGSLAWGCGNNNYRVENPSPFTLWVGSKVSYETGQGAEIDLKYGGIGSDKKTFNLDTGSGMREYPISLDTIKVDAPVFEGGQFVDNSEGDSLIRTHLFTLGTKELISLEMTYVGYNTKE